MANRVTKFLLVYPIVRERGKDEPISRRKVNNSPSLGSGLSGLRRVI